jgi:hypothetical protein
MMKKTKQLRIRITEEQFKRLADALLDEQIRKSSLLREAIDDYLMKRTINKKKE